MMSKTEQMQGHIRAWQESGQSIKYYCDAAGLNVQKFHYWRKKFEQEELTSDFITLSPDSSSDLLKIAYPNGVCIELPSGTQLEFIRQLIQL